VELWFFRRRAARATLEGRDAGRRRVFITRARLLFALVVVAALAAVGVLAVGVHTGVELARFERAEARQGILIHAAGQPLQPGMSVRAVDLAGTLVRLGYVETRGAVSAPGHFRRGPTGWDIALRSADGSRHARPLALVRLDLRGDRVTRVTQNGDMVPGLALEGEVLTGASDRPGEETRPVRLAEVPKVLIDAVLAAEDHRFFEHRGLDVRGVLRAAWANARAGRVTQGGSTITQQLVKNRLLTPRRTFARKLDEAWLATVIDWRYSKERILEGYFNEIYLGQRGPHAIRGIGAAARAFFGKEVHQLSTAEAALLAGMIRAPNSYSPTLNPARARERRDAVLARMRELGTLPEPQYQVAIAEPVRTRAAAVGGQSTSYFTDLVREELEQRLGDEALTAEHNARVETTLDLALQKFAESAVARGLDRLESRRRALRRTDPAERLQAALVALDPRTGQIKALVGGRDYQRSQFNRAALARRQPGSAFKPFVVATALGARGGTPAMTAVSFVDDSPVMMDVDGKPWTPRNYEDHYEGRVTVRRAVEASLNAATVRIALAVGLPNVLDTARTMGIESQLAPVPALALGAFEVTPLELARAYVPLANGGLKPQGSATLASVRAADGTVTPIDAGAPVRVLSPAGAYLVTSLLMGVMESGTGAAAKGLGVPAGLAGKTGTTNDARDAWFVGYAPTLLAAVWVGFDDGQSHGMSGSEAALPIWADFVKQALDAYPAPAFAVPAGIASVDVDVSNGKLANRFCPLVKREVFLSGTEPPPCTDHGGPVDQVIDWWRRFRGWLGR
jgi:1A family penicillin-binding protein